MSRVARARQLERQQPPALVSVPREVLVERALALVAAQESPGSLDAEARRLWALELVPAEFAWQTALRRAFEAGLWAFYDAARAEIVIDAQLVGSARQRVLAHELAHALVDRHFGLTARLADPHATSDARAALHLLAEGDALAVVDEIWPGEPGEPDEPGEPSVSETSSASLDAALPELPPVAQRELGAAYVDGSAVVQRLRASEGWGAIDAAYRAPPSSTHALLAPAPTTPTWVGMGELPEPGWRLVFDDVLGEQALRITLEEWLPATQATDVAADWNGDRLTALERDGSERALLWELRWRSGRGENAAATLRQALHLPPFALEHGAVMCRPHRDAGVLGQWSHDDRLWLVHLTGVPARGGCERLERWSRAVLEDAAGGADPGPRRLIGPP